MNARIVETPRGDRIVLSTVPPIIEDDILLSFGNSLIDFEATLYEKFLVVTKGFSVTYPEFREDLENMEERGLVVSAKFLGKPCWARNPELIPETE